MEVLDLALLRDLFSLCQEFKVSAFSAGGLSVAFHEPETGFAPKSLKKRAEDGAVEVSGFKDRVTPEGFSHPSLWPGQNGKRLTFDGSYE